MGKLIKTVVLDRRTKENTSEYGDFVTCCNCGRTMLVNIAADKCPECDEETLMFEDKDNEEVSDEYFYNNEDYVLADTES